MICVIFMHALTFLNHLLNFLAPAIFLAVLLALGARWMWRQSGSAINLWEQMLLNLVAARPLRGEWKGEEADGRWRLEVHLQEE